jgi:flagellar hook-associated protein 2
LVTSYNAAVDEVTKNRGQNGGALAGQSVLDGLSSTLLTLANYSGSASGSIQNLTDIGLTFDQNGHLQFDASTFEAVAGTSLSNVMTFLGSVSGNTGFLGAANTALTSITDPTDGVIVQETNSLGKSITSLTSQISADQTYVNNLQTSITAQMAAADAAISSLQQQVSQITSLFTAEQDDAQSIANG